MSLPNRSRLDRGRAACGYRLHTFPDAKGVAAGWLGAGARASRGRCGAFAVRLDASGFYFSEAHLAEVSREMYGQWAFTNVPAAGP